jgi:hypothetical protein
MKNNAAIKLEKVEVAFVNSFVFLDDQLRNDFMIKEMMPAIPKPSIYF